MIELYAKGTTDFSKHGIALPAQEASVTWQDNGRFDMDMTMIYNASITIDYGMILRCPVPIQTIGAITLGTVSYWQISAGLSDVPLYSKLPTLQKVSYQQWTANRVEKIYAVGDKVTYIGQNYQMTNLDPGSEYNYNHTPDNYPQYWEEIPNTIGNSGKIAAELDAGDQIIRTGSYNNTYMRAADTAGHEGFIQISKCTDMSETGTRTVPAQRIELQSFTITEITKSSDGRTLTIHAEHISYELGRTLLGECNINRANPATALMFIRGAMKQSYPGEIETNLTEADALVSGDFSWKNAQSAILDPKSGLVQATNGRVIRNDLNVYIIRDEVGDPQYRISYGTNMKAVKWDGNVGEIATRIYPLAQNEDGSTLLLPEEYIDTVRTVPYMRPVALNTGLKVGEKEKQDDGTEITLDEDTVFARMREAVSNQFNIEEVDKPTLTLDVDWQHLPNTAEFRQYADLMDAAPGELIEVKNTPLGISDLIRMTGYTFDPIVKRYKKGSFGKKKVGSSVASYDLQSGAVTGRTIASGAISGQNLQANCITAREIQANSITSDKIASKSITSEFIAAGAITSDEIVAGAVSAEKIAAGAVTADKISAGAVTADKISANAITAVKIDTNSISAINSKLGTATIVNGMIDNANISYAKIMDASIQSLIAKDALTETYYIDKLQVRTAQMAYATVGELVIKCSDNHYYRLDIDQYGGITPTDVTNTLTPAEITAGVTSDGHSTIIETDLVVGDLSANNMKAINALIDKLTASRINVSELWARQAFINQLMVTDISSNTYIQSTIGNWESGSTITQTINSLDSRISSLGYGTVYMQPEEPDHGELIAGDIWIQTQSSGTWEQVYQDYASWQTIYNDISTWQTLGGVPIMWVWDGRKWQEQLNALAQDELETQIQQNAQQISLLASRTSAVEGDLNNKYTIRSGITITADGIDISGSQYVKIASGGVFSVQTGTFGVNSESSTYVIWSGASTAAGSPFWVKKDGSFHSTSGEIGGWNIASNSMYSGIGSTYVNLNSNASNTYAVWAGAETATSAPFRVKRDGTIYVTSLIAVGENGSETTVNLRTAGLWKLNYYTVKAYTVSGGYCDSITLSNGTVVNFSHAASGYSDGWSAAYSKVVLPGSGSTRYITFKYPSTIVDQQTSQDYYLAVSNDYVQAIGPGNITVAQLANSGYANGKSEAWTLAYNSFANTMSGVNLTVTVPASAYGTTRDIGYTVAGLSPYARAGQVAYVYEGGNLVSFTIPATCKTGNPYITTV